MLVFKNTYAIRRLQPSYWCPKSFGVGLWPKWNIRYSSIYLFQK